MPDNHLVAALATWPDWSHRPPTLVNRLRGGLTNRSYLLQADDKLVVLRLNASNESELGLDRLTERQALEAAGEAGVAPALRYCNPATGILVTEYIQGHQWQPDNDQQTGKLRELAQLLQTIHRLKPVDGKLDLRSRANHYWLTIDGSCDHRLTEAVRQLAPRLEKFFDRADEASTHSCLCHNDLLAENLLNADSGKLLALDWEYAAMGDPYFDLAVIVEGHQLNDVAAQLLLESYAGARTKEAMQQLATLRVIYVFVDLLWSMVQSGSVDESIFDKKLQRLKSLLLPYYK